MSQRDVSPRDLSDRQTGAGVIVFHVVGRQMQEAAADKQAMPGEF
jgi:hypothetical protein